MGKLQSQVRPSQLRLIPRGAFKKAEAASEQNLRTDDGIDVPGFTHVTYPADDNFQGVAASESAQNEISETLMSVYATFPPEVPALQIPHISLPEPEYSELMLNSTSFPFNNPSEGVPKMTSCWIAAEHALHHAQTKHLSVAKIFNAFKITGSEYHVQVGFDEELIRSGMGYLEQIHVFVAVEVDADSPLLLKLGGLFSPFPSILFTNSCSYHLPAFKDDGTPWEFSEQAYFRAAKFANGGKGSKPPVTIISYSETPNLYSKGDTSTGVSPGRDPNDGEKKNERRPDKGRGREKGDKSRDDNEGNNDANPPYDPEDPSKRQNGNTAGSANISFEIASDIYLTDDALKPFQTLHVEGRLTIETTPQILNPRQFSQRRVQFTRLYFTTKPSTEISYRQIHVGVAIDSTQADASVEDVHPETSTYPNAERKMTSSMKISHLSEVGAGLTLAPHSALSFLAATKKKTGERNRSLELNCYQYGITEHHHDGFALWDFSIEDHSMQRVGMNLPRKILPKVHFEFSGVSDMPEPPPGCMDTLITSSWSMLVPEEPRGTWIRRLFGVFNAPGRNQASSYSNMLHVVVLRTALGTSNDTEWSRYKAKVDVRSGTNQSLQVIRKAATSIDITSLTVNDPGKVLPKIPLIANFEFSADCMPTPRTSSQDKPLEF